jgi:hypothetical protein
VCEKKGKLSKRSIYYRSFQNWKSCLHELGFPEIIQDGTDAENEVEYEVIIEEKEELAESSGDDSSNNVIYTAQRTLQKKN